MTSDYRFQGVSNTDGNGAVQGNVHYWRPDGWYAGLFASQVDFKDPGHTSYELDCYGGKNLEFDGGRTELKLQLMDSVFPDNRTPGPTYDFLTYEVAGKRVWGKLTTSTLAAFVPEGLLPVGQGLAGRDRRRLCARPQPHPEGPGRRPVGRPQSHARLLEPGRGDQVEDARLRRLRYVDTDRTRANCPFLPKTCGPEVVGTLTVNLPPLMF